MTIMKINILVSGSNIRPIYVGKQSVEGLNCSTDKLKKKSPPTASNKLPIAYE